MSANNVEQFIKTIEDEEKILKKFMKEYEDIIKNYNDPNANVEECEKLINEAIKETETNKPKLRRHFLKCVLFGRISTGKSALVNSLLLKTVVPSYKGPTTNSFVEIKKSPDGTNYVVFEDNPNEKQPISSLKQADGLLNQGNAIGSRMEFFYSEEECSLLKDNVVIVDTPGIDTNEDVNKSLIKECEDADVLLLLLDSVSGLTESEINFISKYSTQFSQLEMLIIFNKWDKISKESEERERNLRTEYTLKTKEYLCENLKNEDEDAEKKIFFISAKERLQIHQGNEKRSNEGWEKREKEFDLFYNKLKITLQKNYKKKIVPIMKKNRDIIKNTYEKIKEITLSASLIIDELQKKLKVLEDRNDPHEAVSLQHFNNKVNDKIQSVFDKKELNIKNNFMEYNVKNEIDDFIKEVKKEIIYMIQNADGIMKKIINDHYFPFILKIIKEFKTSNINKYTKPVQINGVGLQSSSPFDGTANALSRVASAIGTNALEDHDEDLFPLQIATASLALLGSTLCHFLSLQNIQEKQAFMKRKFINDQVIDCLREIKRQIYDSYERFLQQLPDMLKDIINNIQINIDSYEKRLSKLDEIIEVIDGPCDGQ